MYRNKAIFFIAGRISSLTNGGSGRIMIRTALITIAVSVAVMVVTLNIIFGFKNEITSKVLGFASHYTISSLYVRDGKPLSANAPYIKELQKLDYVSSIAPVTTKAGVLKSSEGIKGIALKGIDSTYNLDFLKESLREGELPNFRLKEKSKGVVISRKIANEMLLGVGDKFEMMFISGDNVFRDRLEVVGLYETSLSEFDAATIICDIRVASRVSGFKENQVGGFEITTTNFEDIDKNLEAIEDIVFESADDKEPAIVVPVTEEYIRIFDWLALQDTNIMIVMVIMVFVSAFSMIAMMLIVLIDKSYMIGILKSMGMRSIDLQRLFIYRLSKIVALGVAIGAFVGTTLSYIQLYFKPLKLSSEAYFLEYVPIDINYMYLCGVIVYSFVALMVIQTLPVRVISKMSPSESIKYN